MHNSAKEPHLRLQSRAGSKDARAIAQQPELCATWRSEGPVIARDVEQISCQADVSHVPFDHVRWSGPAHIRGPLLRGHR